MMEDCMAHLVIGMFIGFVVGAVVSAGVTFAHMEAREREAWARIVKQYNLLKVTSPERADALLQKIGNIE